MRYDPLRSYLGSLPDNAVVLTYEEIERLLGRPLPHTAYSDSWRQWWANTETHSQALAWLRAGWRVTKPDRDNRRVEFRRSSAGAPAAAPAPATRGGREDADAAGAIVVPREDLTASALRMLEDAAEEHSADLGQAVAELLNGAAAARRRQLLEWFAQNAPRVGTSSVELIREDRDAR